MKNLETRAKCTTCGKVYVMTEAQKRDAKEMGAPCSPCCHAVATVERVTIIRKRGPLKHG